jgi:hypothetical protein
VIQESNWLGKLFKNKRIKNLSSSVTFLVLNTFAVFLDELKSFNQSQSFVDRAANWQIVDRHLTDNTLRWKEMSFIRIPFDSNLLKGIIYRRVDDKEPSKSNASFLNQDTIITRDCFVEIG